MSISDIIGLLLRASARSTVLALGLRPTADEVAYLLHKPRLVARSLLAMCLITPLVAVVLVIVFKAPLSVEVAVLLMTIAAGAPGESDGEASEANDVSDRIQVREVSGTGAEGVDGNRTPLDRYCSSRFMRRSNALKRGWGRSVVKRNEPLMP